MTGRSIGLDDKINIDINHWSKNNHEEIVKLARLLQ